MHRPTPLLRLLFAMLLPLLVLSACGDDDDGGLGGLVGDDGSSDDGGDQAGGGDVEIPDGIDLPEELPLARSLIPELAHIPLPDGVAIEQGTAYTEDQDPRETAVQMVHLTMPPEEVVEFYAEELPAAGFTIESGADPTEPMAQYAIEFTDPDGLPGHLVINTGAFSASQMNINLFRSGTR